ncbi:hypothetical protein IVB45_17410 [Bradyrhizobium sp. 4]|uniref:hypothetical protein n=1 Tax=unclassified Bradyrhizobium TaxID=2631580 RepID=UPI001FFB4F86|nr:MULTISPECIES: hypothetical protein [unclassified Bradyrhizobium]MCK1402047.1 hypothetical protein [Bradyrhizobium sp. 39]MCK1751233.1 hypothetical protein [Bradyrhizobium sp. 135]UPJ38488.1 hypothetical protein IVB45_17410 [Bradyrhizobium sp. 4]
MSFSMSFVARSRLHALRLLDQRKADVPAPVHAFLKSSIENVSSPKDAQRVIQVEASGHLCDGNSSSPYSSATLKVQPIDIAD